MRPICAASWACSPRLPTSCCRCSPAATIDTVLAAAARTRTATRRRPMTAGPPSAAPRPRRRSSPAPQRSIKQACPRLTPAEVRDILIRTAIDVTAGQLQSRVERCRGRGPATDLATGAGLVDANAAVLVAKVRCLGPIRPPITAADRATDHTADPAAGTPPIVSRRSPRRSVHRSGRRCAGPPIAPIRPPVTPVTPVRPMSPMRPCISRSSRSSHRRQRMRRRCRHRRNGRRTARTEDDVQRARGDGRQGKTIQPADPQALQTAPASVMRVDAREHAVGRARAPRARHQPARSGPRRRGRRLRGPLPQHVVRRPDRRASDTARSRTNCRISRSPATGCSPRRSTAQIRSATRHYVEQILRREWRLPSERIAELLGCPVKSRRVPRRQRWTPMTGLASTWLASPRPSSRTSPHWRWRDALKAASSAHSQLPSVARTGKARWAKSCTAPFPSWTSSCPAKPTSASRCLSQALQAKPRGADAAVGGNSRPRLARPRPQRCQWQRPAREDDGRAADARLQRLLSRT